MTYRFDSKLFDKYHLRTNYRLVYPDENVIRFLVANFPKSISMRRNLKILDLGCRTGRHLKLLNEFGFDAYGIDESKVAVNLAKKLLKKHNYPQKVFHGSITDLPFPDNFFSGLIEHATLVNYLWEDIIKACGEIFRILKKGALGFFLLKRKQDCAFQKGKKIEKNTYLVDEEIYISKKSGRGNLSLIFHAFTRSEIKEMFAKFSIVNIHTWDMSFKSLSINEKPGTRRTSYYIVITQK